MKLKTTLIITFIIIVSVFESNKVFTNIAAPPAERTGAPQDLGTCNALGCHSGNAVNDGTGTVSIAFSDTNLTYLRGHSYQVTFTTTNSAQVRFGFEATA